MYTKNQISPSFTRFNQTASLTRPNQIAASLTRLKQIADSLTRLKQIAASLTAKTNCS